MFNLFGKKKSLIRIQFKSGACEEFWTYTFKLDYKGPEVVHLEWESCEAKTPIHIDVRQIESVWVLKHVKPLFYLGD